MIRQKPLPPDIATRLSDLGPALERCPAVIFAYLFGGAGRGDFRIFEHHLLSRRYPGG